MKKLIIIFISIILFLFTCVCIIIGVDKNYIKNMEKNISKKTNVKNIEYINKYDGYYIVMDLENLYLFDKDYQEIFSAVVDSLHKNKNDYDIIYKDMKVMYMDNYKSKKEGVIFKYYDIYTYELIDEIVIGGN